MSIKRYFPFALACLVFMPTSANAQVFSQLAQRFHLGGARGDLQIQQAAASGLIDRKQAIRLENKFTSIMAQQQQFLNNSGGFLTPRQSQKIQNELRDLNEDLRDDIRRHNPNGNGLLGNGLFGGLLGNAPLNNGINNGVFPNAYMYPQSYPNGITNGVVANPYMYQHPLQNMNNVNNVAYSHHHHGSNFNPFGSNLSPTGPNWTH